MFLFLGAHAPLKIAPVSESVRESVPIRTDPPSPRLQTFCLIPNFFFNIALRSNLDILEIQNISTTEDPVGQTSLKAGKGIFVLNKAKFRGFIFLSRMGSESYLQFRHF